MNNHDNLIIKILISGPRNLPNVRRIQKINKGFCPNIMSYLRNRYNDIDSNCNLSEIIYRIYYHQENRNYCETCGNKTKFIVSQYKFHGSKYLYASFCCPKCAQISKITRDKCTQTCLQKYGVTNGGGSKQAQEKIKQTCLQRYGVTSNIYLDDFKKKREKTWLANYNEVHPLKSNKVKEKIKTTCLSKYGSTWTSNSNEVIKKKETTNLKKYGSICSLQGVEQIKKSKETLYQNYHVFSPLKSSIIKEKIKQTCLQRYGVDSPLKLPEVRRKILHSNIQKGRSSKMEEMLYNRLLGYFNKEDIVRQYKDEKYPFFCDFYIYSINTYIEYQGTWLHGGHPYNPNNNCDIRRLEYMQLKSNKSNYYKSALKCWTIRDVQKRNMAKTNNIRYVEIFSLDNIDFKEIKTNLKNKYIIYT